MIDKLTEFNITTSANSMILSLNVNYWIVFIFTVFIAIYLYLSFKKDKFKRIKLKKVTLKLANQTVEFEIERNYLNLEIAHKIYIELITRKAAIPIDENSDIIVEVYDSWYSLFKTTRNEIKSIKGELLDDPKVESLINMATDVLNKGLRPHLTTYQGEFRRWYQGQLELDDNAKLSPQEIQKQFPKYEELIKSMKNVNKLLLNYSTQLRLFIYN